MGFVYYKFLQLSTLTKIQNVEYVIWIAIPGLLDLDYKSYLKIP